MAPLPPPASAPGAPVHTVNVVSPSASAETSYVFRAAFWVFFTAFTFVSLRPDGRWVAADVALFEHQVSFTTLPSIDQRVVRELGEALVEAEGVRSGDGRWPPPDELAALGVPPFAPDPTRARALEWRLATDGRFASWIGAPSADGTAEIRWFLLFVEEAGERRAVTVTGEKAPLEAGHRELESGELVHYSIWLRDDAPRPSDSPVRLPIQEGWTEVVLGGTARETR